MDHELHPLTLVALPLKLLCFSKFSHFQLISSRFLKACVAWWRRCLWCTRNKFNWGEKSKYGLSRVGPIIIEPCFVILSIRIEPGCGGGVDVHSCCVDQSHHWTSFHRMSDSMSTMKRALGADRACAPDLDFSSTVPTWVHLGVHLSAAKGVT